MNDIYTHITERILKQLESGRVPWRKTWASGLPKSLTTEREYRGINVLLLGFTPFQSRYWVTYRQAQRLGGQVRKGEKATPVVFWHWRTPEELAELRAKTGRDVAACHSFVSLVFNWEQVQGITRPEDDVAMHDHQRLERADNLISVMPNPPEIRHARMVEPHYQPQLDRVILPHLSQFESADEYYATLYHELVHASGNAKRLNRFAGQEGDRIQRYSFEELVAEFGASFLCGFSGIANVATEELAAGYIAGWSEVFRKDPRILLRAASAAQQAADYIRGKATVEPDLAA